MDMPECRGPESIAAEECCCFLPASGIPVFMQKEMYWRPQKLSPAQQRKSEGQLTAFEI